MRLSMLVWFDTFQCCINVDKILSLHLEKSTHYTDYRVVLCTEKGQYKAMNGKKREDALQELKDIAHFVNNIKVEKAAPPKPRRIPVR